jgi:hypothetical protein
MAMTQDAWTRTSTMAWTLLLVAGLCEVAWAVVGLKTVSPS